MIGRVKVRLKGTRQLRAQMERLRSTESVAVGKGLYAVGQEIMAVSKKIVPYKEGYLQRSGDVSLPDFVAGRVIVELGYGGPAVDYAIPQHENLDFRHLPGRTAKYLERPVMMKQPQIGQRVRSFVVEAAYRAAARGK